MKTALVFVAVLYALTVLGRVQAAPANVNAGQLVDRLKELLRQRHSDGSQVCESLCKILTAKCKLLLNIKNVSK